MPRNGSGVYSLPAGYEAETGQTATAAQHNSPLEDIQSELNSARPIVAGGTGATTAAAARTALGLAIGTDVQAYDAGLLSIAGLTTAADRMIYTTALDTYAVATLTAAGRALIDDADAAAQQATIGLSAVEIDILPAADGTRDLGSASFRFAEVHADTYNGGQIQWATVSSAAVVGSPSTIEFTSLTGSEEHSLVITGIKPATDDEDLIFQVQTGGSTWQTSGYVFAGLLSGPGGSADVGSTTDSYTSGIPLSRLGALQGVGNAAGEGLSGRYFFVPGDTNSKRRFFGQSVYTREDNSEVTLTLGGAYGSTNAITGIRLSWGSGNFANQGTVKLLKSVS